jgi:hypothetical protein
MMNHCKSRMPMSANMSNRAEDRDFSTLIFFWLFEIWECVCNGEDQLSAAVMSLESETLFLQC